MSMMNSQTQQILIVDDEPDIRELLEITLARMGIHSHSASNLREAQQLLQQQPFDLCLTDMKLPDGNGIDLIRYIQQRYHQLPVAMITAHGNMESAIEALKAGAFDFVAKPVDLQMLRNLVNTALKLTVREIPESAPHLTLLGDSAIMQQIHRTIDKLARSQAPVYISGESGVGKELVARLIHDKGPRRDKPFVAVNCGAIPTELMESEFFGHKKGSFTGAGSDKLGLFAAADGGTLFLDEVADLPLHMQVKLLRAIQEQAIRPIGANKEININVRILSATHKDLATLVQEGQFRQDLFYRINVIELHVPSLRERTEDIPQLADFFVHKIAHVWQTRPPGISPEALAALSHYAFPGNVRELENILERAMTLCEGMSITTADLQLPEKSGGSITPTESAADAPVESLDLDPALYEKEKEVIMRALEKTRFNKTAAAKLLGISFRALRYRIKKLGIE